MYIFKNSSYRALHSSNSIFFFLFSNRKTEKSPLRSILKKSPSTSSASAVMLSDSPKVLNSENTFELASISKSLPSLNESILKEEECSEIIANKNDALILANVRFQAESRDDTSNKTEDLYNVTEDAKQPPKSLLTALIRQDSEDSDVLARKSPPKKHVTLQIPDAPVPESSKSLKSPKSPKSPSGSNQKKPVLKPQPQLQYNVPQGAKIPKVGDQRSRKPTLASQWRKQKERQKQEEQGIKDRIETFVEDWPYMENDSDVPNVTDLAEAGFYYR